MKKAVLFLHGVYRQTDIPRFNRLCRGRTKVAVDGGLKFFQKANLMPDLLIGDFDSIGSAAKSISSRTTVLEFPVRKDKTDAHLALDYCLKQGATSIDIVSPSVGEVDHFVGNLMLMRLVRKFNKDGRSRRVRVIGRTFVAEYLCNGSVTISNYVRRRLSVVAMSRTIQYSCSGTDYNVSDLKVATGDSRALRNRITSKRCRVSVKGEALVIHSIK